MPGTKVTYQDFGRKETGIVKSLHPMLRVAFVVYKCNNDWKNYQNYTGCPTSFSDLVLGWVDV